MKKICKILSTTTINTTDNLMVIKEVIKSTISGNIETNLVEIISIKKILIKMRLSERQALNLKAKCLFLQTKKRQKNLKKKIINQLEK